MFCLIYKTKQFELQRYHTSIVDLHRIFTSLFKKLNDRLEQKYFGHNARLLVSSINNNDQQKITTSFIKYLSSIIEYINKYYVEHSSLAETLSIFGIDSRLAEGDKKLFCL